MSEANVDVVRRSMEAFVGGDFDTAFAAYHPDAAWTTAEDEPDARTYRGLEEIKRLRWSYVERVWTDDG